MENAKIIAGKIAEIEAKYGISMPKKGEYYEKHGNPEWYHCFARVIRYEMWGDSLRVICEKVKTSVGGEWVHRSEDPWGDDEVIRWICEGALKKSTEKKFSEALASHIE